MKRPGGQERRPDTVSVCDLLNPFEGTGVLKKEICGRTVFTGRRPLTKIGDGPSHFYLAECFPESIQRTDSGRPWQ